MRARDRGNEERLAASGYWRQSINCRPICCRSVRHTYRAVSCNRSQISSSWPRRSSSVHSLPYRQIRQTVHRSGRGPYQVVPHQARGQRFLRRSTPKSIQRRPEVSGRKPRKLTDRLAVTRRNSGAPRRGQRQPIRHDLLHGSTRSPLQCHRHRRVWPERLQLGDDP